MANPGEPTDATTKIALTEGYTQAFLWGGFFLVAAAIITAVFLRIGKDAVEAADDSAVVHIG